MKRRSFIKTSVAGSLLAGSTVLPSALAQNAGGAQRILEWRRYAIKTDEKRELVDDYLKRAYLPAVNRLGIKPVGVFHEMPESNDASVYRLTPFESLEQFATFKIALNEDNAYRMAAAPFFTTDKNSPAYERIDTTLMRTFSGYPNVMAPRQGERIFELRTYESHDELKGYLKVEMFNEAELEIFKKVHLDGVFYGEVLAGASMPRLTYMLAYKDKEEREKNWKAFLEHPDWTVLKGDERYKDTVSNIQATFLRPAPYSQI